MSRKPRNNHYHYAEQYSDGHHRRKVKAASVIHLPRRAVFFAVLVLLVFGFITATFSANTSTENAESGSILISIRNAKANRDLVLAGAKSEDDLAVTGANVGYAPTAAQTYYYKGQANGSNWAKTAMTVSADGFYEYYQVSSDFTHQFLIGTASNENAYNHNYVSSGFNSTNVSEIGDYSSNNCYCWKGSAHYIIVYYPNTLINTSNAPKICASTSLPDNTPTVKLGEYFTNENSPSYTNMTNNSGTYTVTKSLTGNLTRKYFYVVTYRSDIVHYYKNPDEGTMDYTNCTNWTFTNNTKADTKLTTVITGNYVFTLDLPGQKAHVTYPSYTVTTSVSTDIGTTSNTATPVTRSVAIGSSVQVSATTTDSAYNFINWTVTSGSAKTGSYTGTDIGSDGNTSRTLTIYPCGTSQTVNLQANYEIKQFNITYRSDATSATAEAGTITNPHSISAEAKQYGIDYTITSDTFERTGYTQVGWSTTPNRNNTSGTGYYAFGDTYSTNAALTLYPVWELNTPTKSDNVNSVPQIVSNANMVVGNTVSLDLDVKGGNGDHYQNNNDITRTYACSISGPSGHNASVGDNPSSSDFMKFTADLPGTYTVSITVTDTSATNVTNANNQASATTNTATIIVQPDIPVINVEVNGYSYDAAHPDRDGSQSSKAYMILLGSRYHFSAAVDATYLANHPTTNYTYEWAWDEDFAPNHIISTNGATSFDFIDVGTQNAPDYRLITYDPTHTYDPEADPPDPDPRMIQDVSDEGISHSVSLYCRVTCNDVSNKSMLKQKWYFIQPLIDSFEYEPMQKIFNLNDQTVSLAAEYNVEDDPNYTTTLFFSHNNSNTAAEWREAVSDSGFIRDFKIAVRTYLYPSGSKFFYLLMSGYNNQGDPITSRSGKVHTTVHTSDSSANRTLYFNNTTTESLRDYQVMCYYIDGSGSLCYQIAQDRDAGNDDVNDEDTFSDNGYHYRVMVPEDAQSVRLGFLDRDTEGNYFYGEPELLPTGVINGFAGPTYYGYSQQFALDENTRWFTLNHIEEINSLYEFSFDPEP